MFVHNPCYSKLLHMVMEGEKINLSKPIQKKEPITPDILEKIIAKYEYDNCKRVLICVRVCAMFLHRFARFCRIFC